MRTLAAAFVAAISAIALVGFGLRAGPAEAQGLMTAPACQCSAASAVPGLSTTVSHCLCGGVACVLSQHGTGAASAHQMQCVRS